MPSNSTSEFHCPVCRAKQLPSSICRRCKCDLSLLMATAAQQHALHTEILRSLREGRPDRAIPIARQLWSIDPDEDAARLLAVCYLTLGNDQAALDVCQRFHQMGASEEGKGAQPDESHADGR